MNSSFFEMTKSVNFNLDEEPSFSFDGESPTLM